jgi:uncharacterized Ntn-hydrolase superfamily protein
MRLATFSIVARDKKTGEFGVAAATAAPCVGAMLPFAEEGVGAIATQAWVNVNIGYQGMLLMRSGLSVRTAIEAVLSEDKGRARRQAVGIDSDSVYAHTGEECTGERGHLIGDTYGIAGNTLSSARVLDSVATAFKGAKGELSHRFIEALEAGQRAGGDSRGKMSAALLVASPKPKVYHNLRVDMSPDPLRELRRIHEECVRLQAEFGEDAGDEDEVLRRVVPRAQRKRA